MRALAFATVVGLMGAGCATETAAEKSTSGTERLAFGAPMAIGGAVGVPVSIIGVASVFSIPVGTPGKYEEAFAIAAMSVSDVAFLAVGSYLVWTGSDMLSEGQRDSERSLHALKDIAARTSRENAPRPPNVNDALRADDGAR
jgi:hypothetical protein